MAPARKAYSGTDVSVEQSQSDIRKILIGYDADSFTFGQGRDWAGVEFIHRDVLIRMKAPVKIPSEADVRAYQDRRRKGTDDAAIFAADAEHRRIWRVLHWSIKARMEAVDAGVESFEQAFLAHVVDPSTNRTLWESVEPAFTRGDLSIGGAGIPALTAGRS